MKSVMCVMKKLTQSVVHELLLYDPFTGALTWRRRDRKWFRCDRDQIIWNTRYAGCPAFTSLKDGYGHGRILGHPYRRSHIVWLYMTGHLPRHEIDHQNRKCFDDRWSNLQDITHQQNCRNLALSKRNKSGRCGVRFFHGKYRAEMFNRSLGSFPTFQQAYAARAAAEREHGFSPGHGRRRITPNNNSLSR